MRLADLPVPSSPVAAAARSVTERFSPPALVNHCARSYLFAVALGSAQRIEVDHELLFVASMLHDLALEPAFDNVSAAFEDAGADLAWVFTAGAGWPVERRRRSGEIIVAHMHDETDPSVDPEGYLLARATSLDISGRDPEMWPVGLVAEILAAHPRRDLADLFIDRFEAQARRKPSCTAAAAVRSGIAERIRRNPLG